MKVIKFIMLYQFFDAQEIKLKNRLIALERVPLDRIDIDTLHEIETIKIKLEYLQKLYSQLVEFIIDL